MSSPMYPRHASGYGKKGMAGLFSPKRAVAEEADEDEAEVLAGAKAAADPIKERAATTRSFMVVVVGGGVFPRADKKGRESEERARGEPESNPTRTESGESGSRQYEKARGPVGWLVRFLKQRSGSRIAAIHFRSTRFESRVLLLHYSPYICYYKLNR
jgi:hypothetical protein